MSCRGLMQNEINWVPDGMFSNTNVKCLWVLLHQFACCDILQFKIVCMWEKFVISQYSYIFISAGVFQQIW